jgi:hypothetical protein
VGPFNSLWALRLGGSGLGTRINARSQPKTDAQAHMAGEHRKPARTNHLTIYHKHPSIQTPPLGVGKGDGCLVPLGWTTETLIEGSQSQLVPEGAVSPTYKQYQVVKTNCSVLGWLVRIGRVRTRFLGQRVACVWQGCGNKGKCQSS